MSNVVFGTPTIVRGTEHAFPFNYAGNDIGQTVGLAIPFTDNATIGQSLMVDDGGDYLTRTQDTADSKQKATFSWWFKRGSASSLGAERTLFAAGASSRILCRFDTSDRLVFRLTNSTTEYEKVTGASFSNTGDWYNVVWQVDATQGTAANRSRVWINGSEVTSWSTNESPAQNTDFAGLGDGSAMRISSAAHSAGQFFDGYFSEFNYIDNSIVDVSTFGLTDTTTGLWIPKTLTGITYGTNGFRLTFADVSNLGDDTSGNTNDFTATNLNADNKVIDSPSNSFAIMGPIDDDVQQTTAQGGQTTTTTGTNQGYPMIPQFRPTTGKFYAECRIGGTGGGNTLAIGVIDYDRSHNYDGSGNYYPGHSGGADGSGSALWYVHSGTNQLRSGSNVQSNPSLSLSAGDIIGIAIDCDENTIEFFDVKDSMSSIGKVGMNANRPAFSAVSNTGSIEFRWNFGQNGTFNQAETAQGNSDGNNIGDFYGSVPSGFLALCQDNLSADLNFGRKFGIPDLTFIKEVDASSNPHLYDTTRGVNYSGSKLLQPTTDAAQSTQYDTVRKFVRGGFEVGDNSTINGENNQITSLNWVANGGTTSANTDGSGASIASTIQANQTAGFSIVQWTGSGSAGTIAHGLGAVPAMIWSKCTSNASTSWYCYIDAVQLKGGGGYDTTPWNRYVRFNSDDSHADSGTPWNDTAPTSNVFSVGDDKTNQSSRTFIAYCFANVNGYSKSGVYAGNSNDLGPFVHLDFKPAIVMIKGINIGNGWTFYDFANSASLQGNPRNQAIVLPETSVRSTADINFDILSNGFRVINNDGDVNGNYKYYYYAWAYNPFIGDGVNPTTAGIHFADRGDVS